MIPLLYLKHAIPNHVHHMFYPVQEAGMPPCFSLCAPIHDSPGYVLGMYQTSITKVCHILCSWYTDIHSQQQRLVCLLVYLGTVLLVHGRCVPTAQQTGMSPKQYLSVPQHLCHYRRCAPTAQQTGMSPVRPFSGLNLSQFPNFRPI